MSDASLSLVGLGLGHRGISLAGLDAARSAAHVFLEAYTAVAADPVETLEALVENEVAVLDREAVEDGKRILDAAEDGGACVLVPGDPLSATTHTALRLAARARGIEVRIHFGASILNAAAGLLGLSHYKFGRTTTLVTPQPGFFPESPYEVLAANRERDLHTLVLLDIRPDGCMTAPEGAELLLELERRRRLGAIAEDTVVCALARVGLPDAAAWYGPLSRIAALDAGEPMHTLVVPGALSEHEQEALAGLVESA